MISDSPDHTPHPQDHANRDPQPLPRTQEVDISSDHTKVYEHADGSSATSSPSQPELPLPFSLDQFVLTEEFARGGMGVIYRARESSFRRELAVKVLLRVHAEKTELHRRSRNEASITAQLEHPGVVPVHTEGRLPDGRPYFSMQLVLGQTLANLIRNRPNPSVGLPKLLKVFEQVCQTLAYAHSRGVVHRDVKPANVIVAPFGVVKVIDWGVAKVLPGSPLDTDCLSDPAAATGTEATDSNTRYGVVLGTIEYMAPEQVGSGTSVVDTRADVFALGGMLCHILTGRPPYVAGSFLKVLDKAGAADLRDAFAHLDYCGAEHRLVQLAKHCLAANPEDRPADARLVASEVSSVLECNLRQAERDLERFFELSLDMFCIAGLDGFFKRVNDNFSRVLGHSTPDLLKQPFLHFVHPDDWAATQAVMGELQIGRPVVRFQNRYRDIAGEYHLIEWTAKSIPDEGVVFAIARDVTRLTEV